MSTEPVRIGVCGGPYGNPYALQAFVDDARARGCGQLFCLGDLGGFGAEVDALWPILTGNDVTCVAGNYDVAIARADPDCGCGYRDPRDNAYAQLTYDHTLAHTSRTFAAWMGQLPTERRYSSAASTCTWCTARRWRSTTSGGSRYRLPSTAPGPPPAAPR